MWNLNRLARGAGALGLVILPPTAVARWSALHRAEAAAAVTGAARAADNGSFRFETEARDSLRTLWTVSLNVHQERVACIGGDRRYGVANITRVKPLVPDGADSLHISAKTSLEQCGAPEWFGTVHTHIAKFDGIPFATFSPDDRWTMELWRKQWRDQGVFCVLYSETEAHCEAGAEQSDDPVYSLHP
jgi:hypothetical protein